VRKIKIGVTGTGSLIGQAIIKSIQRSPFKSNISLIGFDYFDQTIGSSWIDKTFILPDFLKKEVKIESWLERIIEVIKKEDIRILLIGIDFELTLFAKYKDVIESRTTCKVIVSDARVIDIANDKYLTYRFLKDHNLHHPQTVLPEEMRGQSISFPCIFKPRIGAGSKDVFIIHSLKELKQKLPAYPGHMIQELIGDESKEYTCGVICFDNEVKELMVLQRELKKGVTVSACFHHKIPSSIRKYVGRVAEKLKPYGACNFQLRLDHQGTPKIFEINARHSGTTYIRSLFGFKEVEYVLAYLLGFKMKKFVLKEGKAIRYYEEALVS